MDVFCQARSLETPERERQPLLENRENRETRRPAAAAAAAAPPSLLPLKSKGTMVLKGMFADFASKAATVGRR